MHILIIKTGSTISSLLKNGQDFEDWFQFGMGLEAAEVSVCNLHQGEPLPNLDKVSGVVITGSPAFVTDLAPWNFAGADYLREAHAREIPILGICYGHQMLAWAFGGSVDFNPQGREIGTVPVVLSAQAVTDPLFQSLPAQFKVQVSHLQSVLERPHDAVLLASNDFDINHGFRIGRSTWCLQFHPEFDADITRAYIRERSGEITSEGLDPAELLAHVEETATAGSLLLHFARYVRENSA